MPLNQRTARPIPQIPLHIRSHREAATLFMRWYGTKAAPLIFIGSIFLFFAWPAAALNVGNFPINYAFRALVEIFYYINVVCIFACVFIFYRYKKEFESRERINAMGIVPDIPPQTVTVALVGIIQVPDIAYQS
ncbi:hypothetical protein N7540_000695 [Penicillium herquei]|nr:hypothetical protein N7540_000695 [Penicillium herquei]